MSCGVGVWAPCVAQDMQHGNPVCPTLVSWVVPMQGWSGRCWIGLVVVGVVVVVVVVVVVDVCC